MAYLWEELEKSPKAVQEAFFTENLEKETISSFSEIKKGDHLVAKGAGGSYFHHFMCIEHSEQGKPKIIHYFGTSSQALAQCFPFGCGSGKNLAQLGRVQQMVLPHKDFLKDEAELKEKAVQRLVWPQEMRRYSAEDATRRAHSREGEQSFDLVKHNCENFIMWCLCGLNISLQVKKIHFVLREILLALRSSVCHVTGTQIPKALTEVIFNLLDDAAVAAGKLMTSRGASAVSRISLGASIGVGALMETIIAGYDIHRAHNEWKGRQNQPGGILIKSREEFIQKVTEIVTTGVSRFGFGTVGMMVGQTIIPVPILGGVIGALLGAGLGHCLGRWFGNYAGKAVLWIIEELNNLFGQGNDA